MMPLHRELGRRSVSYSLAIFVSLAIGTAGVTWFWSILSQVGAIYGYFEEERLVRIMTENKRFGFRGSPRTEWLLEWKDRLRSYDGIAGFVVDDVVIPGSNGALVWNAALVDPLLLKLMDSSPLVGRTFDSSGDPKSGAVVLVSETLAESMYGDPLEALGRVLTIDGQPQEIIGVVSANLGDRLSPSGRIGVIAPLDYTRHETVQVFARLRRGRTVAEAQSELAAWGSSQPRSVTQDGEMHWVVLSRSGLMDTRTRRMIQIAVLGGVIVLILMASNVAHLLGAQAERQRKELATRWALGAGRWFLFRRRFREALLLTVVSGAVAGALASWGIRAMTAVVPEHLSFLASLGVERVAFLLALAANLLILLSLGTLLDVFRSSRRFRSDLASDKQSGTLTTMGRAISNILVVTVVAACFVLGVAAYLVTGTVIRLGRLDVGFEPRDLQVVTVMLPEWKFEGQSSRAALFERLVERLSADPRIDSVALSSQAPSQLGVFLGELDLGGQQKSQAPPTVGLLSVGPQYFRTLRQKLAAGRAFDETDLRGGTPVVVVSEAVAKLMGSGPQAAIGRSIRFGDEWREIVGVAADISTPGLVQDLEGAQVYWPLTKYRSSMTVLVRMRGEAVLALRNVLQELDPDIAVELAPMQVVINDSITEQRFLMAVISLMALLAMVLVFVGVYSILSNFVYGQRGQISLRIAVGASRNHVMRWIIWKGLSKSLAGVAVGIVLSYPCCRLLADYLFGIEPDNMPARIAAIVLVVSATIGATWIPATRAASISPMEVLKES